MKIDKVGKDEIISRMQKASQDKYKPIMDQLPELDKDNALRVECGTLKEVEAIKGFIKYHYPQLKATRRFYNGKHLVYIKIDKD